MTLETLCDLLPFAHIFLLDTEFYSVVPGDRPTVVCLVIKELRSGVTQRFWQDELNRMPVPPFPIGEDAVFIAYYSSAEWLSFLALGWQLPCNVIDFYTEFRWLKNGVVWYAKSGLVDALDEFGIPSIGHDEKDEMRELIMSGRHWDIEEKAQILAYCTTDVVALEKLFPFIVPRLDLKRALFRGRSMVATARMEFLGTPIDVPLYNRLLTHWDHIQEQLIERINWDFYCVFEGRRFKSKVWAWYLMRNEIAWPCTPSGRLDLKTETFESMLRLHPEIEPIYNVRNTIGKMRLRNISVGTDGRNRCLLSPFRSRTGRNQPSSAKFILGAASWMRGLVRPEPGRGLGYVDFCQQEFGVAAALSNDPGMMAAYSSGDPYIQLARSAGYVPFHATKESHPRERSIYKETALAVQYGLGVKGLANKLGTTTSRAEALLNAHKKAFPRFWAWSDDVVRCAILQRQLTSGPSDGVGSYPKVTSQSARNFPMQSAGADILRLSIIFAHQAGVKVLAPLHDAVLIEFDINDAKESVIAMQNAMRRASELTLGGFPLGSEAKVILYPDRYMEDRGRATWDLVWTIVNEFEKRQIWSR